MALCTAVFPYRKVINHRGAVPGTGDGQRSWRIRDGVQRYAGNFYMDCRLGFTHLTSVLDNLEQSFRVDGEQFCCRSSGADHLSLIYASLFPRPEASH
jgi:hypothetical protein